MNDQPTRRDVSDEQGDATQDQERRPQHHQGLLTGVLHLLQPEFPSPTQPQNATPPPMQCHSSYILHPPPRPAVCDGQWAVAVCTQPKALGASAHISVQPQLHSYYLLIIPDTAATGSTIITRAECKSVTFVLTLFLGFFFSSTEWWHVKHSPGGCSHLEQYGNWDADS